MGRSDALVHQNPLLVADMTGEVTSNEEDVYN